MIRKETIPSDATAAAIHLKKVLPEILGPKYKVVARAGVFGANISHIYIHVWGINPNFGIEENSPVQQKIMMHLTNGIGNPVDFSRVSYQRISGNYALHRNGIKMRKISSSKSIMDCTLKLVKWFSDNKPHMDKLLEQ